MMHLVGSVLMIQILIPSGFKAIMPVDDGTLR